MEYSTTRDAEQAGHELLTVASRVGGLAVAVAAASHAKTSDLDRVSGLTAPLDPLLTIWGHEDS